MNKPIILLDPAHGEETPGKRSPDGNHREYLWSRQRCKSLYEKLTDLGYIVFITNPTVNEIGINKRKEIANKIVEKVDSDVLLISLHNDAFGEEWTDITGYSVYTSKGATKSDLFADILMKEFMLDFPELKARPELSDKDLDREENFTVLMGNYSAVLVEWLFQNNKKDVKVINDPESIIKFENCIIKAILKWP